MKKLMLSGILNASILFTSMLLISNDETSAGYLLLALALVVISTSYTYDKKKFTTQQIWLKAGFSMVIVTALFTLCIA